MKKLIYSLLTLFVLGSFSMNTVQAAEAVKPTATTTETPIPEEIQVMINRVYEIKEMDRSNLTVTQRKELKKELRGIKSELRAVSGIYLSVGALIIIILLLILLL
jgi:hypothetical protein